MDADLWVIEVSDGLHWYPVREVWFRSHSSPHLKNTQNMTPRSLEECSECACAIRERFVTYQDETLRMRNIDTDEIVPFEIFTGI